MTLNWLLKSTRQASISVATTAVRDAARAMLGDGRLLGVSCYNEIARVIAAADAGADIVGIGAMFVSATKPAAVRRRLACSREARSRGPLVAAIGGITWKMHRG